MDAHANASSDHRDGVAALTTDRWAWTFLASVALFVLLCGFVSLTGVTAPERSIYEGVTAAFPSQAVFRWITRLGSERVLFPVATLVIAALPRPLARRWWIWVAVMLLTSCVEGLGKEFIGRSRPESLRPGFPSGHTASAAAFYTMAAYFAAHVLARRWARYAAYATAAVLILAVGVSRIVLRAHWPLDVLGGAALGIAMAAGAAWWHERNAVAWRVSPTAVRTAATRGRPR